MEKQKEPEQEVALSNEDQEEFSEVVPSLKEVDREVVQDYDPFYPWIMPCS